MLQLTAAHPYVKNTTAKKNIKTLEWITSMPERDENPKRP